MEESHALDMLWHEQSCVEVLGDGTIYLAWMTVHGTRYPKFSKTQIETKFINLDELQLRYPTIQMPVRYAVPCFAMLWS